MNKKVYLSYPISNHEDNVFEHDMKMKKLAIDLGLIPVSPLDINKQTKKNIDKHSENAPKYLGNDIKHLLKCKYIMMGKGWEHSRGCKLEYYAAMLYHLKILFE